MARSTGPTRMTVYDTFSQINVDGLKRYLTLAGLPPLTRKEPILQALVKTLTDFKQVLSLYAELTDIEKKVIQEATHDPLGEFHASKFDAKYGKAASFDRPGSTYYNMKPAILRLFFANHYVIPTDLHAILRTFVPAPAAFTITGVNDLPARVRRPQMKTPYQEPDPEEIDLKVRETTRAALLDVKAVIRLIDQGNVKVGDKSRKPSQASIKAIAKVLSEGDFYSDADRLEDDPDLDLTIQPFAWPMLIQAAGMTTSTGTKLGLSPVGQKAIAKPAHEIIRQIWDKWLKSTLLDEFNRVDAIKGQQSKNSMTALVPRRKAFIQEFSKCPVGQWISIEDLFRLLQSADADLGVSRDEGSLSIGPRRSAYDGYAQELPWECLQGRYTLVMMLEYAGTLGLVDVAYISPVDARNDYDDYGEADDLSCLSRYDGLMYIRINPLGAWCLNLTPTYVPAIEAPDRLLKVLANYDIIAADKPLSMGDSLLLERFAERRSESVWKLSREQIRSAVEQGLTIDELRTFLTARIEGALPHTVQVFLHDLEDKFNQLEDFGVARMIACRDHFVAQTLLSDRRLKNICQVASERYLVYRASDEATVRKALKDLGYILPPPK